MNTAIMSGFMRELEKLAGKASMIGLGGLTALEGAGAFDKEKSKKERAVSGGSAAFTGSILADELHHAGAFGKAGPKAGAALGKLKGLLKAAAVGQAAMMKNIAKTGLRPEMAAKHGLIPSAAKAAPATVHKLRPASEAAHSSYSDFTPAGRFTPAGSGMRKAAMRKKSKQMANYIMTHDKGM